MTFLYAIAALSIVVAILAALYRPLGDYMAWAFTSSRHLRVERSFYRLVGVDPDREQPWRSYLRSVLAFSAAGVLIVYGLQRLQHWLPWSLGMPAIPQFSAFNTAVSFVTNTNWQSSSPETTLGYAVQLAGLCVQNFVSAAVGIAVSIALIRGFARTGQQNIGNFWGDLMRAFWRILLPIAVIGAVVLITLGVVQNFSGFIESTTMAGGEQRIPGGPVASQEIIKNLGTNGGGFFNANGAHPFENPNAWTNLIEIIAMLAIPVALTRTFGTMVRDTRQGLMLATVMLVLWAGSFLLLVGFESFAEHPGMGLMGASLEGKETRWGTVWSSMFATTATGTSTGAFSSAYGSYSALGGMMLMINMMLGEVSPGGVGSGLYGLLIMAIVAVFIAGLLVGRTPEFLGKRIGPKPMKLASLYVLVTPTIVLAGTALSLSIPGAALDSVGHMPVANPGSHGFSELLYAFTSAANNNGSAFAGLTADTPWMNVALAVAMLLGRFVPIMLVLALAGTMARQDTVAATAGTLDTHKGTFMFLLAFIVIAMSALTYFPALALGPLAEGLA